MSKELIKEKKKTFTNSGSDEMEDKSLVLYNDDYHTFDFVIKALIDICKHDIFQAEQCTLLVHYKGRSDVKSGSYKSLKPFREGLTDRGLKAQIE